MIPPVNNLTLTNTTLSGTYQAQNQITAETNVSVTGTAVLKAGNTIDLKPGFTASSGCNLTISVGAVTSDKYYYLKDHLGSIRVVVDTVGEIVSYSDYDPWGMILNGRSSNFGFANDKYKFTGKELDTETGYFHFGARVYDGRIGRWNVTDPLFEKYPNVSPYNYALNNPLRFIDPKGMEAVDATPDDPDDPKKKTNQNPFLRNQNQESKTITGEEVKIGGKTVGEVTTEVSARSSKLITAVDNNMPTFLDGTAFALAPLSFGVSAAISLAAGLWTLKNDSKDGNYNNSAISFITMVLSGSVESPYLKLGIQGSQVFYDLNGPIQNTSYSESLINEIKGTNDQLKKYYELGQIGY